MNKAADTFRQGVAWILFVLGLGIYYVHERLFIWSSQIQGETGKGPWDEHNAPPPY